MADLNRRVATLSADKRALVEEALRRRRARSGVRAGIPRRNASGPAPLSFSQQRIWFLEQWEPGTPTNHGARVFHLRGPIDVSALATALERIVERHEILRTVYLSEGADPYQIALDEWALSVPVVDLSHLPGNERERELQRLLRDQAREPFDLEHDVMLRATLFRLGVDDHVLLIRLHHIAYDAYSDRILLAELSSFYAGDALPELPIQYADFAAWQRANMQGEALAALVRYWSDTLDGAPRLLKLPSDRPRLTVQRHEGQHHRFTLPGTLAAATTELARSEGVTVYMALLAVFAILLYRVSGEKDVVIGSPIASRNEVELERLIGFFSNTLVLRNRLGGSPTFREVLQRTKHVALGAYAHQELPFERIVETLKIPRDPSYNPLFQVNFRAQAAEPLALALPGVTVEALNLDIGFARFDLALELRLHPDRIEGYFEFDHDLFDLQTVEGLTADLASIAEQVLAEPDLPILALKVATRPRTGAPTRTIPRTRA